MRQLQLVFCNLLSASLVLSGETSQQSLSERNFAPACLAAWLAGWVAGWVCNLHQQAGREAGAHEGAVTDYAARC